MKKYNLTIRGIKVKWSKKLAIMVDITAQGRKYKYYLGYMTSKFDKVKELPSKNAKYYRGKVEISYSDMVGALTEIRARLYEYLQKTDIIDSRGIRLAINPSKEENNLINNTSFDALFTNYLANINVSPSRKRRIKNLMYHWNNFRKESDLSVPNDVRLIDGDILIRFKHYLISNLSNNTAVTVLKILRAFFNYCEGVHKIKIEWVRGLITKEVYSTPFFLTQEERDILYNNSDSLPAYLERAKDMFLFQCFTGVRFSDLIRLTKDNFVDGFLVYIPVKTCRVKPVEVKVPLHSVVIDILNKYDYVLPIISMQKYNSYIKILCKRMGLNRPVTIMEKGVLKSVPLYDVVSSHTGRRTFIGNLYGKIDREIIASMSGHTANSKAFSRYYAVTEDLKKKAIELL